MTTNINSYYDFASLAQLKSGDAVKQQENSKAVLKKFEALFIDQMLQSMRKATTRSELFDTENIKLYESLFDKEISEELSRGQGLGLNADLEQSLGLASTDPEAAVRATDYLPLERSSHTNEINRSKALSLYSKQAMEL
jgi:flagellar protein FlgJ